MINDSYNTSFFMLPDFISDFEIVRQYCLINSDQLLNLLIIPMILLLMVFISYFIKNESLERTLTFLYIVFSAMALWHVFSMYYLDISGYRLAKKILTVVIIGLLFLLTMKYKLYIVKYIKKLGNINK